MPRSSKKRGAGKPTMGAAQFGVAKDALAGGRIANMDPTARVSPTYGGGRGGGKKKGRK